MSDDTAGAGRAANGNGHASESPPDPASLVVNAQYVKDLSFENPNAPASLLSSQGAPQVQIGVEVETRPVSDDVHEVLLNLKAEAKSNGAVVFLVELTYGGVFTLRGFPEEHKRLILLIEAPRLLFPFARAVVADATRDGGFPPLIINPIDFTELYRRQVAAATPREAAPESV